MFVYNSDINYNKGYKAAWHVKSVSLCSKRGWFAPMLPCSAGCKIQHTKQVLNNISCLPVTKAGSPGILHCCFLNKTIQKPSPEHRVIGLSKACSCTERTKPNTTYHVSQHLRGVKFLESFNPIIYFSHFLHMTTQQYHGYDQKVAMCSPTPPMDLSASDLSELT